MPAPISRPPASAANSGFRLSKLNQRGISSLNSDSSATVSRLLTVKAGPMRAQASA
jgi:hypothetical protein